MKALDAIESGFGTARKNWKPEKGQRVYNSSERAQLEKEYARLQTELHAAMRSADPALVVVDMSGVEFCDSTGMNVLLAAHRQACERGGDLALAAQQPPRRALDRLLDRGADGEPGNRGRQTL